MRQAQKRLTDQIGEHQDSNHNYFQEGVRLLELSEKAYFLFEKTESNRKAPTAGFCVFELDLEARRAHCYVSPTF